MDLKSVMTANPACCTTETSVQEVAKMMQQHDCGQIPVLDNMQSRKPIGVVTDRDIALRIVAKGVDAQSATAGDCLSKPCVTVSCDSSLADCCEVMESRQIRRVPVVDADGCICGIVALADVAHCGSEQKSAEVVKKVSIPAK